MKGPKKMEHEQDETLTVIARGTFFKGKIDAAGEVVIYGNLEGKISASESLTVAPSGVVQAIVTSQQIYINGQVRGTLHTEELHLDSRAQLIGDVHTSALQITEGAVFRGSCSMPEGIRRFGGEVVPLTRSA
jgi:cytoskeletal protein CcmA (bactofilin family)